MARVDDIARIREGLLAAAAAVRPFTPGAVAFERKEAREDAGRPPRSFPPVGDGKVWSAGFSR